MWSSSPAARSKTSPKRVPLPRVILGGASGLEWRLPGGHRIRPGDLFEARREKVRATLDPLLARLSHIPGVDMEDKGWSVAIHHRHVLPEVVAMLEPLLKELEGAQDVRVYRGPSVAEVQLLRNVSKSFGVRTICRIIGFDPSKDRIVYAGDDTNDAVAMRWVLRRGGSPSPSAASRASPERGSWKIPSPSHGRSEPSRASPRAVLIVLGYPDRKISPVSRRSE
ncbi:trehalose-phosphatase [Candidatus Deferrimicrobium sp.]|uniref:trehalose-phosphatase n=1 Tax=Candidatus Deferrimicrobium sp. TaxID=3060586 RepID=UPI0027267835|nr:trehalose-phosphatase [Candidatus Deferrimicrobium sp.]MDO8739548.1 trehalose-phosphatase [Candidatus Deferrimicrobium sp.]